MTTTGADPTQPGRTGVAAVLPVSEQFGPTIQGEGPYAGRVAWFVRLGGCNLSCTWCDSAYTWDASRFDLKQEIHLTAVGEVLEGIPESCLVVLTGGEPLLHQRRAGWRELCARLKERHCTLQVETNGTIEPDAITRDLVDLFVVSPKLTNAGPHRGRQDPALHRGWIEVARSGAAHLKVVCESAADVAVVVDLARELGWPASQVWAMPEGVTEEALKERWGPVAEAAAHAGINASHRLHILAWQDRRGC